MFFNFDLREQGIGLGFILSFDGEVLINVYVVEGVSIVKVIFKDGFVFEGKVMGIDMMIDVVVVKVEVENLFVVEIG